MTLKTHQNCFVFDVKTHPIYSKFTQCTTEADLAEKTNTILSICFMYFLPFLFILYSYGNIIYTLTMENETSRGKESLRRSDQTVMDRAKIRALKLTFTIVAVFIICWSPYIVMTAWHVVDRTSAENVHPNIQEGLFIMVVANSCANPLVYGVFHSNSSRKASQTVRGNSYGNGPMPSASAACTMSSHFRKSTLKNNSTRVEIQLENMATKQRTNGPPHSPSPPVQVQSVCYLEKVSGGCSKFSSRPTVITTTGPTVAAERNPSHSKTTSI
ncbi:putative gonadotropin-releasing hormone II receptor [Folsomia candida]|uniref:putative gonadotropin-releasing hormone II receptor n=1 Tax=Folsomia candida TaxID=158441 RepID=UPI0016051BE8|nr:putative gonadotropin-releasing hormone II receptor [Folsomia candida]